MSRKNKKNKYKRIHALDLERDKIETAKIEKRIKDQIEREYDDEENDEDIMADEDGMQIEKVTKKIKKNKIFQKRLIKEEKKRMRKARNAPILVTKADKMNTE